MMMNDAAAVAGPLLGQSDTGVLAQGVMLVSPVQPLAALALVAGWAWVVARVYDPDAERWYLDRNKWNTLHMTLGAAAVVALLAAPTWLIGFPVMIGLLGASLVSYWLAHNKSDQVPASQRWTLSLDDVKKRREERAKAKQASGSKLELSGPNGVVPAPPKDTPEYELRLKVEELLLDAVEKRASDLEILPAKDGLYGCMLTVDGVGTKPQAVREKEAIAAIDLLKHAAGLDVNDRRRKLTGDLTIGMGDSKQQVRVQSSGGSSGMKARVIFNPGARVRFELDELGLLPEQQKTVEELALGKGVVLSAAPPRGGRTSTLYGLLRHHDAYIQNVQTLELDPQDLLEGVKATHYDPMAEGPDYATTLRSILRRDPDVVMVGELPDQETAKEVCAADHERTRLYVGLRAENALGAIQGFVKGVGDPKLAAEGLRGVVTQKLARKLCENCKAEYRPTADMLKKLGVPADKAPGALFRKGGQVLIKGKPEVCPVCRGTGFVGQVGVFEVFPIGAEERELIGQEDWAGLRQALRKSRLPTIQEAAVKKVLAGDTSVEEVVRITSSGKASSGGGGNAAKQASNA